MPLTVRSQRNGPTAEFIRSSFRSITLHTKRAQLNLFMHVPMVFAPGLTSTNLSCRKAPQQWTELSGSTSALTLLRQANMATGTPPWKALRTLLVEYFVLPTRWQCLYRAMSWPRTVPTRPGASPLSHGESGPSETLPSKVGRRQCVMRRHIVLLVHCRTWSLMAANIPNLLSHIPHGELLPPKPPPYYLHRGLAP